MSSMSALLREFVLELTDRCAQRCMHCSSNSSPDRATHLDRDVALDLIRQAAGLGATQVSFGGGEPFASPLLLEAIQSAISLRMAAEVFTSGVVPSHRGPAPLGRGVVERLVPLKPLKLIFSIHGGNADIHDQVTQTPGSFEATLHTLRGSLAAGIPCELNFVPLKPNVHELHPLVELACASGIARLSILRFVPQGRGLVNRRELELSAEEEDEFVGDLVRLRGGAGLAIRTGSPFNGIVPGNGVRCRAGDGKLVVQADGNILPCEVYKHESTRDWGLSVYRRSLGEAMASASFVALREQHRQQGWRTCPVHHVLRSAQTRRAHHGFGCISTPAFHLQHEG